MNKKLNVLIYFDFEFNNYFRKTNKYFFEFLENFSNEYNFLFFHPLNYDKKDKNDCKFIKKFVKFPFDVTFIENKNYRSIKRIKDCLEYIDNIQKKYKIDIIINFKNFLRKDMNEKKVNNQFKNFNELVTFDSVRRLQLLFYFPYYLTKKYDVPIIQFINDPMEFRFCDYTKNVKKQYFFHKYLNLEYFPNYEYSIFYKNKFKEKFNKELNFTFGYTVLSKEREKYENLYDDLSKIKKSKIFIKDRHKGIKKYTDYLSYMEFIKKSKYTLVIPPYKDDSFSIVRFYEAIAANTIPLIHCDVNINHLPKKLLKFYINKKLIIKSTKDINYIINNNKYDVLIKDLKKIIKIFYDFNYYKDFFNIFKNEMRKIYEK